MGRRKKSSSKEGKRALLLHYTVFPTAWHVEKWLQAIRTTEKGRKYDKLVQAGVWVSSVKHSKWTGWIVREDAVLVYGMFEHSKTVKVERGVLYVELEEPSEETEDGQYGDSLEREDLQDAGPDVQEGGP